MPKIRRAPAAIIDRLETRMLLSRAVGADVSQYQGSINWTTYKNANGGQNFALMRASSSDFGANADANGNAPDTAFNSNASNAKTAGVLYGVYHFGDPTNTLQTATQQANYFLSVAQARMGTGYLPPTLDVEAGGPELGVAALSTWVNSFCTTIFNATGVKPMIYCNSDYASHYLNSSVTQWPLWIARWNGEDPQTYVLSNGSLGTGVWPASAWKFWQYTNQGVSATYGCSGGNTRIDLDVYNGDVTALQSFVTGAPEVTVLQNSNNIADGTTTPFNFGTVIQGQNGPSYTFTVRNDGGQLLTLSGLTVPTGYTITEGLVTSLSSGQADNFTVRLDSSILGTKSGDISFANNDSNENPFNFAITGQVNANSIAAPSNLHTTSIGTSTVQLAWNDNSNNETQFLVERKIGTGLWSQIGQTNANVATYTDNNTQPATQYYYHVRATDGNLYSSYTTPDLSVLTLCDAPTNMAASDGDFTTKVHVTWTASAGAASYQLYRSTNPNDPAPGLLAPSSTTSYDDTNATPGTTYYYWVTAKDSLNRASAKSTNDGGYRAIDTTPPAVVGQSFDYISSSQPAVFSFSEDVESSISVENVTVQNLDTLASVGVFDYSYDPLTATASYYLAGVPLPDGHYRATLAGAQIHDAQGNPMESDVTMDFFVLTADANHDATVDTTDFNLMVANFSLADKTYAEGDFNYDGSVDTTDFNLLAASFSRSMAAPAAASAPRAQRPAWSNTLINTTNQQDPIDSLIPV